MHYSVLTKLNVVITQRYYNTTDCIPYVVLFISATKVFDNWKFVPLHHLQLFHPTPSLPLPIPPPTSPLVTTSLFSVLSLAFLCLFICLFCFVSFFDSTYRGHHMVFAFLCQTLFLVVIVSHQQTQAPLTIEARQSRDIPCADCTHPPTLVRLCPILVVSASKGEGECNHSAHQNLHVWKVPTSYSSSNKCFKISK